MSIPVSTLRPGLLVNVSTSIKGNVKYLKTDGETITREDGSEYTDWETERTIKDPAEQKLAVEVRSKARNLVVAACIPTEHGLLCPVADRTALDDAFDKARALVDEFNTNAKTTRMKFNALAGYIAATDKAALKAINGEIRDLISEMKAGIENLDVERVRDAAKRTKKISNMMLPDMKERVDSLVKEVREQATKLKEAGEQAATAIDSATIARLNAARTSFLDIGGPDVEIEAVGTSTARAIDLTPHDEVTEVETKKSVREFDLAS